MGNLRERASALLAVLFGASGVSHLASPALFQPLIPRWLPRPRAVVYASGIAELVCAGGLLTRAKWARSASTLLLLGIFPGNVQMAVTASRVAPGRWTKRKALAVGRLPLQLPLIWAAMQCKQPLARQDWI